MPPDTQPPLLALLAMVLDGDDKWRVREVMIEDCGRVKHQEEKEGGEVREQRRKGERICMHSLTKMGSSRR